MQNDENLLSPLNDEISLDDQPESTNIFHSIFNQLTYQETCLFNEISPADITAFIHDAEELIMLYDEEPQTDAELLINMKKTAQVLLRIGKDHIKIMKKLCKLEKQNECSFVEYF